MHNHPHPGILSKIRVVLCRPSHPGNIGAVARAMKTMGLSRLVLVEPPAGFEGEARALAAGAPDVLGAAAVCGNLAQALSGTVLAGALTGRRREWSAPVRSLRGFCAEAVAAALSGEVALVFGTERHGLSNEELALCHVPVAIPADSAYPSLNLAAAVQVVAYELRMAALGNPVVVVAPADAPATFDQIEGLIDDLHRRLLDCGFLDPHNPRRLMPRLRRLLARARLEREEVNLLRGMLRALDTKAASDKVDQNTRTI